MVRCRCFVPAADGPITRATSCCCATWPIRAGLAIDNARLYQELERRVRERTRELEDANRELEAFSYSVAHDLRAPLRSIDGFAHMLFEDHGAKLDADGLRYLGKIRGSAQHMGVLIDGLLALAHVGRVELRIAEVSLSDLGSQISSRGFANRIRRA